MSGYVTDRSPGSGARLAPRSGLDSDAPRIDLNGIWRFRLLPSAPGEPGAANALPAGEGVDDVASPGFDDSGLESIPVPSHWVLQGEGRWGRPIYTNKKYPFPVDPPHVPDENPTGDYRRRFALPDDWEQYERVVLRFDGVESRYRVWVNGIEIGTGSGSRLRQEFDITAAATAGENLIVVRVHQWSAASYLEDQDQWWMPGIFRDVSVELRPVGGFDDLWLRTPFDGQGGRIDAEVHAAESAYPIRLTIEELGVDVRWESAADVAPVEIPVVDPWTAETPRLYQAVVTAAGETVRQRVGFRTVSIEGDQFLVNGRKVRFRGVNRHDSHPKLGRVFDEEHVRDDLLRMKRANINAIRTSHYPPHPRMLEMTDELGFWVVLECDLEAHGFELVDWVGNPSDDPDWQPAYLDRIQRTVERDKNHPSIIMWSLGNESGTGQNLAAMSHWVHARDPERPVHYERDYAGEYTDVYSRMYATVPELERIGSDDALVPLYLATTAQTKRLRSRPFLQCEYIHAMGNGAGAIEQYEQVYDRYPCMHGGFVWEWRDHGIRSTAPDGTEFFAYGGDFGEELHDGNFVTDGMLLSDGTPTPMLAEFAQVVSPVRLRIDDGSVEVSNRRHWADTSDLALVWRVEREGVPIAEGELDAAPVAAGETGSVPLPELPEPDGAETWLTVSCVQRGETPWAAAGHALVHAQRRMDTPQRIRMAPHRTCTEPVPARVGIAEFDGTGLIGLAGARVAGPRLELWRAPTDNDRGFGFGKYDLVDPRSGDGRGEPAPADAELWHEKGLHRLRGRVVSAAGDADTARFVRRWGPAADRISMTVDEQWTHDGDEVHCRIDITPNDAWDFTLPRIGIRLDLPDDVDEAAWFGTGPQDSYPDSRRAARVGAFEARIDDLTVRYARPQESGHRSDLRRLTLRRNGRDWLEVRTAPDEQGRLPGFTLSRYAAQQLSDARHPHELRPSGAHYLYIDAAQHGLGSRAAGPDVWPTAALTAEARSLRLILRAL